MVLKANDAEANVVRVIKIVEKVDTYHPEEVEDVYREFVFLSRLMVHPNIVQIVDMLHSRSRLYLVFEFAGDQNMAQILQRTPEQRFAPHEALEYFDQLLSGLAFCHSKQLAHRCVSLEHLAVDANRRLRILDFRCAVVSKGQNISRTICGRLPCIAPEVAAGKHYVPRLADSWSAGIILLELSAGLNALSCAIPYDRETAQMCSEAPRIHAYFEQSGSHEAALSCRGATPTNRILAITQVLLVPDELVRVEVQQLFRTRPPQQQELDQA